MSENEESIFLVSWNTDINTWDFKDFMMIGRLWKFIKLLMNPTA